jgi:hypothetical protein
MKAIQRKLARLKAQREAPKRLTSKEQESRQISNLRERALMLGRAQVEKNVRKLIQIRDGGTSTPEQAMTAIAQLDDRYGYPRNQQITGLEDARPKLVVLRKFVPPPSWNGDAETPGSEAPVTEGGVAAPPGDAEALP